MIKRYEMPTTVRDARYIFRCLRTDVGTRNGSKVLTSATSAGGKLVLRFADVRDWKSTLKPPETTWSWLAKLTPVE